MCAKERSHLAHAAANIIRAMTVHEVEQHGEDLLKHINKQIPLRAYKVDTKPSPATMRAVATQLARKPLAPTDLDIVIGWVAEMFAFDKAELDILITVARWGKFETWRELVRRSSHRCSNITPSAISLLSKIPISVVEEKLMEGSRLLGTKLLRDDHDGEFALGKLLKRMLRLNFQSRDQLDRWLMPDAEKSSLEWEDFEHLGVMRDLAEKVTRSKEPISILLYGAPGTGKTEFARALAQQVEAGAVFAGLVDEDGGEPERAERLSHLMLLRALCRSRKDRLIVVDEADDVLLMHERKNFSKQWLNRLVENPEVPTIWIVNQHRDLDPALLRRMSLVLGFEQPRQPVRERIALRAATQHGIALAAEELREVAALKTSAAVVSSGLRTAKLAQGGALEAQMAIHGVMRAMGQSRQPDYAPAAVYDPGLSRADTDLERLATRLVNAPDKGWTLLLSGPSGTGKSAFARHLALRMGVDVEERRCSDLISPYVGETESNIAEAFAQATERGAMLLIDEVDSFLHAREEGQRSWEISKVNEMLVQMDHLRVPFVATTNLADKLDPATQRRFTLRVAFQAMSGEQARSLFRAHFAQDWPTHYPAHEGQTPGDFAVVANRARLLGESEAGVLLRWLREEVEARGGAQRGAMGFCVPVG
ncbi:AAA family ATPase [Novosphingobium humi]|uniref:ATP-binding protein n=1 Tax=Novosphingobium humi TaxID=2282397 RepID=A0ABY7U642_9SPHN|nr:ATP-binding protein [Novosphingobium humi]WCT80261.1 ATP-binding protein [Novosphingobium humi]